MRYFDVTDGQLGLALEVKRQTVNSWINGRTRIPDEFEKGIAAYFGVEEAVLRMEPDDALRWVLAHPELTSPEGAVSSVGRVLVGALAA